MGRTRHGRRERWDGKSLEGIREGWNEIPFTSTDELPEKDVTTLAFTPNGDALVMLVGREGMATAKVWTIGKAIGSDNPRHIGKRFAAAALSADGRRIAGVTEDGKVYLIDIISGDTSLLVAAPR